MLATMSPRVNLISPRLSTKKRNARAAVLKMLCKYGAPLFRLNSSRLDYIDEFGRVLVAKGTLPEIVRKLLDANYQGPFHFLIF